MGGCGKGLFTVKVDSELRPHPECSMVNWVICKVTFAQRVLGYKLKSVMILDCMSVAP